MPILSGIKNPLDYPPFTGAVLFIFHKIENIYLYSFFTNFRSASRERSTFSVSMQ